MEHERRPLLQAARMARNRSTVPSIPRRSMQLACVCVLTTVVLERIAFYSIVGNLVMFLNSDPYAWDMCNALNMLFVFTAVCYIITLFGGWLADAVLGRCKTIVIFLLVYIAGYCMLPMFVASSKNGVMELPYWCSISKHSQNITDPAHILESYSMSPGEESCSWQIHVSLVIIAIGCGVVKVNLAPFGADQVRGEGAEVTSGFFTWFYWCINIGALIALGPIAYIQQVHSFFIGYVIPISCLMVAFIVFIIGIKWYGQHRLLGSVLSNLWTVLSEACRRKSPRCCCCNGHEREQLLLSVSTSELDAAPCCLDAAKVTYGGECRDSLVDDVKTLLKIFLVLFSMLPFWIIYFQMNTTFLVQGLHMRFEDSVTYEQCHSKDLHRNDYQIAVAWLSLFNVIVILILLPVMDKVVYPALKRKNIVLTLRMRIVIGMVTAAIAVCCAGIVENKRLNIYWRDNTNHTYYERIGSTCYFAADLSIFWQVPQYVLMGVSEVFASVAAIELSYLNSPQTMRSVIMAAFWFIQGVGSLFGTSTIQALKPFWFSDWDMGDINCENPNKNCHLDYYYFLLAGIGAFGVILFLVASQFVSLKYSTFVPSPKCPQSASASDVPDVAPSTAPSTAPTTDIDI